MKGPLLDGDPADVVEIRSLVVLHIAPQDTAQDDMVWAYGTINTFGYLEPASECFCLLACLALQTGRSLRLVGARASCKGKTGLLKGCNTTAADHPMKGSLVVKNLAWASVLLSVSEPSRCCRGCLLVF